MNFFTSPFTLNPQMFAKSSHGDEQQYELAKTSSGVNSSVNSGVNSGESCGSALARCCDQTYEIYDSLVNRKFHPAFNPFGFFHFLTYQHTRQLIRQRRYDTHVTSMQQQRQQSSNNYEKHEPLAKHQVYRSTELNLIQSSSQKTQADSSFNIENTNPPSYEDNGDVLSKNKVKLSKSQTIRYSTPAQHNLQQQHHHHHQQQQQQNMLLVPNPFFSLFGSVETSQRSQARHRSRTFTSISKKSFQNSTATSNIVQPEFTLKELDLVLYGFMRSTPHMDHKPGLGEECDAEAIKTVRLHALSGLRVGQLSHGMDRILSGSSATGRNAFFKTDPAVLDLPDGLAIEQTSFAGIIHWGIFAKGRTFEPGVQFGPYQGRLINTSEMKSKDDNSLMWEIFFPDGQLSHFIDGRGTNGSWMSFLNCARTPQEQNMVANQKEGSIFYEVIKEVKDGHELLVWYDDKSYFQFLGIPVAPRGGAKNARTNQMAVNNNNNMNIDEEVLKPVRMESEDSEGYQCERCGKVFAYQYYRDKHLKYTRCVDQGDRKFPCHMCSRSFEKRDRLRIHVLHVHEKHRPHKCLVCSKSFSQSSSLNKHMRVHSGERPYKCVYCSKAFTASSILRTHIRQHSGEKPFKCKHCGKAFASHAAHDSHVRRTHAKVKVVCSVCGLQFNEIQDLKIHFRSHDDHLLTKAKELTTSYCRGWEESTDMNINQEEPLDVEGYGNETDNYV